MSGVRGVFLRPSPGPTLKAGCSRVCPSEGRQGDTVAVPAKTGLRKSAAADLQTGHPFGHHLPPQVWTACPAAEEAQC